MKVVGEVPTTIMWRPVCLLIERRVERYFFRSNTVGIRETFLNDAISIEQRFSTVRGIEQPERADWTIYPFHHRRMFQRVASVRFGIHNGIPGGSLKLLETVRSEAWYGNEGEFKVKRWWRQRQERGERRRVKWRGPASESNRLEERSDEERKDTTLGYL